MRLPRLVACALVLGAIAACSSPPKTVQPSPSKNAADDVVGFTTIAQYVADATLADNVHTERITVTLGAPQNVAEYRSKNATTCPVLTPKNDVLVPLFIQITNTSPATASPVMIGNNFVLVVNRKTVGPVFAILAEDTATRDCKEVTPAVDLTSKGGGNPTPDIWGNYSRPDVPTSTGQQMYWRSNITLSGGGEGPTPPVTSVFLRLTQLTPGDAKVTYRITTLKAQRGVAGVVKSGTDKGAFYMPLDPHTSPCTLPGADATMNCGSDLAVPA